jgi:hypothetical protein
MTVIRRAVTTSPPTRNPTVGASAATRAHALNGPGGMVRATPQDEDKDEERGVLGAAKEILDSKTTETTRDVPDPSEITSSKKPHDKREGEDEGDSLASWMAGAAH